MEVKLLHIPDDAEELIEIAGRGCYGTTSVDKAHSGYLTIKYNDLVEPRPFTLDLGSVDRDRLILDDLSKLSYLTTVSIKDGKYTRDVEIIKYEPPSREGFIRSLMNKDHTSVIEHIQATFDIKGISRACSHQLVRHRIQSISQKSQRYVKEDNFGYVVPATIEGEFLEDYNDCMSSIDSLYKRMIEGGIRKEDARYILPNACTTDLVNTFNLRSLMNLFDLRGDKHAQEEIRVLAIKMLELVKPICPNVFYRYKINYDNKTIYKI